MTSGDNDAFFIGWRSGQPRAVRRFGLLVAMAAVLVFAGAGALLGLQVDDPARNLFARAGAVDEAPEPWLGDQLLQGVVTHRPTPILHLAPDAARPGGRALLLSGYGKRGAEVPEGPGPYAFAGGLLRRGSIEMLVIDDVPRASEGSSVTPLPVPLGRWRAVGEICDGKCYPGGMKPGSGLAHRACATLCIDGAVPAIFVVASPVAGATYLLLAGPDGGPLPADLRGLIARPIELEGDVERLGAILVFKVDPARARAL